MIFLLKCLLETWFSGFLGEIICPYRKFFFMKVSARAERRNHFTYFGMEVKRDYQHLQLQEIFFVFGKIQIFRISEHWHFFSKKKQHMTALVDNYIFSV